MICCKIKKSYHILQVNFTFSDVLIAQCSLRNRGDPSKGPAQSIVPSLYWSCHMCVWSWEADRQFQQCSENQYPITVLVWSAPSFRGSVIYIVFAPMQTAQSGNTSIAQEDEQCLHRGSHHRTWMRVNVQCLLPMQVLNTQDTSLYMELNAPLSGECFASWFQ